MSHIERFEALEVWQLAKNAANQIYDITSTGKFGYDYVLRDQIKRVRVFLFFQILPKDSREMKIKNLFSFFQLQKHLAAKSGHSLYLQRNEIIFQMNNLKQ